MGFPKQKLLLNGFEKPPKNLSFASYFFVHCPLEEKSPGTANYFKDLLEKQGVSIENMAIDSVVVPTQLNLFDI